MDDLIAFLRQQLAEDERVINGACLHTDDCNGSGFSSRFDDDRLLAEVEAKRRILDECERRWHAEDPNYDVRRTDDDWGDALAFAVKALAQPHAGREGWREEWSA